MTQIRVRELAGQLGVTPQEVLTCLQAEGRKVRGPSTVLAESVAAGVRRTLRRTHPPARRATRTTEVRADRSAPVTAPTVPARPLDPAPPAGPVATAAPGGLAMRTVAVAPVVERPAVSAPITVSAANPFLQPGAVAAFSSAPTVVAPVPAFRPQARPRAAAVPEQRSAPTLRPAPVAPPAPVVLTAPTVEDPHRFDQVWRDRGISVEQQRVWVDAGLRPDESSLADRCLTADIAPHDLKVRLSGRTALQRLRDGESVTSVWARIQEAGQQQPRTGTRLTGRFRQR